MAALSLETHAEMLTAPLHDIPSANGCERATNRLNRLPTNRRSQREKLRRHAALMVNALQVFIFPKKRLQHFAAADQPLARTRLRRLLGDEVQRFRRHALSRSVDGQAVQAASQRFGGRRVVAFTTHITLDRFGDRQQHRPVVQRLAILSQPTQLFFNRRITDVLAWNNAGFVQKSQRAFAFRFGGTRQAKSVSVNRARL